MGIDKMLMFDFITVDIMGGGLLFTICSYSTDCEVDSTFDSSV